MSVWTVSAACLICAAIGKVLEKQHKEYALAMSAVCACGITLLVLAAILPVRDQLESLLDGNETLSDSLKLLMKSLAVCTIAGFSASACRDAGESGLARGVELMARVTVAGLYLPVLVELLKAATGWLGGNT
ncbi:MAG: hypothetical protein J6X61_05895 [Clostridia bacterium]|nr:hypothetical protein [Clostridia bacterium]